MKQIFKMVFHSQFENKSSKLGVKFLSENVFSLTKKVFSLGEKRIQVLGEEGVLKNMTFNLFFVIIFLFIASNFKNKIILNIYV
jgi:hypothetical protein